MINITRPIDISFNDWASVLQVDLMNNLIPLPTTEDKWWDWASQLLVDNDFIASPLPLRDAYPNVSDWSKWGAFFIDSVNSN